MTSEQLPCEAVRDDLIGAACDLAVAAGPTAVTIPAVARAVRISETEVLRHFTDRRALVREVASRGLSGLVASLQSEMGSVSALDPVLRARMQLAAVTRGYVEHAVAEPGLFRTLFTSYPDVVQTRAGEVLPDPIGILGGALDDLCEAGVLTPARRAGAEVQAWSAMHGFAMLYVEGPLRWSGEAERAEALADLVRWMDHAFTGDLAGDLHT